MGAFWCPEVTAYGASRAVPTGCRLSSSVRTGMIWSFDMLALGAAPTLESYPAKFMGGCPLAILGVPGSALVVEVVESVAAREALAYGEAGSVGNGRSPARTNSNRASLRRVRRSTDYCT